MKSFLFAALLTRHLHFARGHPSAGRVKVKDALSPAFAVLVENTLVPTAVESGPSYLLLLEPQPQEEATAACDALAETLARGEDIALFQPLLSALAQNAEISILSKLWLHGQDGKCVAYNLDNNSTSTTEPYAPNTSKPSARIQPHTRPVSNSRLKVAMSSSGIPYAKPPVGERRLMNPERMDMLPSTQRAEESVYDATAFKPLCPQEMAPNATPDLPHPDYAISEDCLYLNVYTPLVPMQSPSDSGLLPVLVWIHGGSNYYGGSSLPFYLGMNVASRGRTVVVSFNYRLGILGFLDDPDGSPEIGSNQAMRDQVLALEWVRDNIRSYGGDPDKVTIFGESSGGSAVMSLFQTSFATDLFSRAIIQSGSATYSGWQRPDVQERLVRMFLDIADCKDLHCIKYNRTTSEILLFQSRLLSQAQDVFPHGQVNPLEPFRAVIDGDLIEEDWGTALAGGRYNRVPTLVTYTKDEFGLVLQTNKTLKDAPPISYTTAVRFLSTFLLGEERTEKVLSTPSLGFSRNLVNAPDVTDALVQFTTDITYRCSSEIYAGALERYSPDVWEVSWDIGLPRFLSGSICGEGSGRACHAAELPILFGSADYANISGDVLGEANYYDQARDTIDLYSGFARDGILALHGEMYPRRGGNGLRDVLHWGDEPVSVPGGVRWGVCMKMEELGLYDRLYYPHRGLGDVAGGRSLEGVQERRQELQHRLASEARHEDL
ncbi:Carboxylesterase family protein [Aspergillus mulundensis]|uniref:Carboxylesterase family protein n=1 Tax=Aspergillus mulundensis TaxID=1810919 RepID=A0A3D8RXY9_9EURO|nr:Carboxylesterase family protein [Aspergillus mulundensis]RDW78876.1 Carboxylesterase family protein [Aspergillus mulundensis]